MELLLDVRSHSHRLTEECFSFFARNKTNLRLTRTSDQTFSIGVDANSFKDLGSTDVLFHAHWWASAMLVGINIATAGYFCWSYSPSLHPVYRVRAPDSPEAERQIALQQALALPYPEVRDLTEDDVQNALIISSSLAQDQDSIPRSEYLKGLLHVGASHLDITFHREAFGNFYRCIELFVTQRVLGAKRLANEVKDIQRALGILGVSDDLQGVFTEIYAIRSSQFAHAQAKQVAVSFDDVLKAKAFADIVMYKTYRKVAEKWRSAREA